MKYLSYAIGTLALMVCGVVATTYAIFHLVADCILLTGRQILWLWQGK